MAKRSLVMNTTVRYNFFFSTMMKGFSFSTEWVGSWTSFI